MFGLKDLFAGARDEPVIDTRLRTDVYKFNMMYFARALNYHNTPVVFGLTNRDSSLRLADVIPESYLREQLDHIKSLKMSPAQASFVQGMTVTDAGEKKFMYPDPSYSEFMSSQTLSDYELRVRDGQFDLTFQGTWFGQQRCVSHWEVPVMATLSESYVYWYLKRMLDSNDITHSEIESLFAAAFQRVVDDAKLLRSAPGKPTFANFGLRRFASRLWSTKVQHTLDEMIPDQCIGASDVQLSFERGSSNPIGTVAHERDGVFDNLGSDTDDWIREAPFLAAIKWAEVFPKPLRILLPDSHGSRQFYEHAPVQIAKLYAGTRVDSMPTADHDPFYLAFLKRGEVSSRDMIVIPSDGQGARSLISEHAQFGHQYRAFSAGIGGGWTNNIKGLAGPGFRTPNIVIKAWYANGRPCTKVGDAPNGGKVTGPDATHNARVIHAVSPEGWRLHTGTVAV